LSAALLTSWRDGVTASANGDREFVIEGAALRLALRKVPPAVAEVLRRLNPPGLDQDRLAEIVQAPGNGTLAKCHYYLERLTQRGLICHKAQVGDTCLATLIVISPSFVSGLARAVGGRRYVLSRFAYLRRQGDTAVLESPLAHARIVLNDCRAAAVVGALAAPARITEVAKRVDGLDVDGVAAVLALLLRAGMLDDENAEDWESTLTTWEFHDLLFHARTRLGRFDAGYGRTYRFADRMPPPPALKPDMSGQAHDLYRPDLESLERDDPPLAWVQSRRRSSREFDSQRPITDRQLGEFLFRVARVTNRYEDEVLTPAGPVRHEFALRPYPAGGSLYELEMYLAIHSCNGLAPGLYHYDPAAHRLIHVGERTGDVGALLRDAAESTGAEPANLQVLILLASRFPRVAWKYESIAYALTLKHVGVLYQTMYLAATAMGLGACAIGGGNADLFARAAGTDYFSETSVGEFLLGSPRP
jgi:SagB-type dehydrogenase family enzyme